MEENSAANIADNLLIEDNTNVQEEVEAQELSHTLTENEPKEQEKPAEEPKAVESPEKTRKDAINAGLTALAEEGVTSEELLAFSQDEGARKDIQAGKDVIRAFMAYSRRKASAEKEAPAQEAKKAVPTVKAQGTAETAERSTIKSMSKKEFAEFLDRAREAAAEGKLVSIK